MDFQNGNPTFVHALVNTFQQFNVAVNNALSETPDCAERRGRSFGTGCVFSQEPKLWGLSQTNALKHSGAVIPQGSARFPGSKGRVPSKGSRRFQSSKQRFQDKVPRGFQVPKEGFQVKDPGGSKVPSRGFKTRFQEVSKEVSRFQRKGSK